ncbi:DUF177 domain-containing protein [Corynebacterium incognita]|uniref:DUF177 domain-containing protein n=1 Tax=Corynebacterium incognita TaxID=2754725 RepID=A0A7G7CQE5_9CORY|nr:YceD family protein [Corynebacterium incognita]QNE89811.1 DUF177 domain-containing protein [Corynebacterium incognita]
MNSPFVFNVAQLLRGETMPEQRTQTGPAPARIGVEMIAIKKGDDVTVDATLTPLGTGILVDADVTGTLTGECSRCLAELHPPLDVHVSQFFAADEDSITGDPEDEADAGSGDETPIINIDELDLLQTVIDEVGLTLPFNPTCEGECVNEVPTAEGVTTGISGEEERVDPRWSGLEKFL